MSIRLSADEQQVQPTTIDYPASDGEPMAETEQHILAMLYLIGALRHYFRHAADVYVIGNMFLYYIEGKPNARRAPDVMVIKGVGKQTRRIYKLWEEKVAPCAIFEVTSRQTKSDDIVGKSALYASLGVREYFLFDPLHDYLDRQLEGYRLADKVYLPIPPNEDGEIFSEELQLILQPDGAMLRLIDPKTGETLPGLEEALDRIAQEAERAQQAIQRAEHEAQRAEQETQRAAAAEAEEARLRALLAERNPGHEG